MAELKYASTIEELKSQGISSLKDAYVEVAKSYNSILDLQIMRCPICGDFKKTETAFYQDNRFIGGRHPVCKECILMIAEQRVRKTDTPNETKESVQKALMMLDRPYDDDFYDKCVQGETDGVNEKDRH